MNLPNVERLTGEVWAPIPGFPNYFASTAGRVASAPRRATPGGLLKQNTSQPRRPRVSVSSRPGQPQTRERIARLVCLTFHGPRPSPHHDAAHRDGDALNNTADNVFWRAAA